MNKSGERRNLYTLSQKTNLYRNYFLQLYCYYRNAWM